MPVLLLCPSRGRGEISLCMCYRPPQAIPRVAAPVPAPTSLTFMQRHAPRRTSRRSALATGHPEPLAWDQRGGTVAQLFRSPLPDWKRWLLRPCRASRSRSRSRSRPRSSLALSSLDLPPLRFFSQSHFDSRPVRPYRPDQPAFLFPWVATTCLCVLVAGFDVFHALRAAVPMTICLL